MQENENDILKRVRKIEIKTRGLSNEIFAGKYHTAFRGRGMSFSEVREYRAGDDVRDIDWNVTARSTKPHIKIYEEERELTMMLLIDVSGSRMFGTGERLKKSVITEIAAVLAFSASQNNDKVGCIFFSDRVEKFIPPKKGRSHILMIIRELVKFRPESQGTAIAEAVRYLTNVNKKHCTAFILSDFIDSTRDRNALDDALKIAGAATTSWAYAYGTGVRPRCRMWASWSFRMPRRARSSGSTPRRRACANTTPRAGGSATRPSARRCAATVSIRPWYPPRETMWWN